MEKSQMIEQHALDLEPVSDGQPLADLQAIQDVLAEIERSMRPGAAPLSHTTSVASRRAQANFQANIEALKHFQPQVARLLDATTLPTIQWLIGRDGSLAARDDQGKWLGGSSLPLEVARGLLRKMEPVGQVLCLLAPTTAHQIAAAFERLAPTQALIVVIPDETAALVALHGHNFSHELKAARLWLACGLSWEISLGQILSDHPGLNVPQQYIRTALLDEPTMQSMTQAGNRAFAQESQRRDTQLIRLAQPHRLSRPKRSNLCVLARSHFSPASLPSLVLSRLMKNQSSVELLDIDHPLNASPLALSQRAESCNVIVAADVFRSDCKAPTPGTTWLTWATTPRLSPPDPAYPQDCILLTDPAARSQAARLGWRNIHLAVWPTLSPGSAPASTGALALVADAELELQPQRLKAFSSHALLWEAIARELMRNPLLLVGQEQDYLVSRVRQLNIDLEQIDAARFTRELIIPAYRQGLARLLSEAGLPLVLFGRGWNLQPALKSHVAAPIESIDDLTAVARTARAVLCPLTDQAPHWVEMLGRPVVYARSDAQAMVRETRAALRNESPARLITADVISAERIISLCQT